MRISVVTVCMNAAATLADALESVARQSHSEVEHIVIDGGSTDGTADLVARHGRRVTRFVSEPDRGLYDAMNKGAALATGEVVAFLNADDWYAHPDVLAWVAECVELGADLVYADLRFLDPLPPFTTRRVWRDRPHAPADFLRGWQPAHPTCFVRLPVFRSVGGFDLRWRISADYAFLTACMRRPGVRIRHLARHVVEMRLGGASTQGVGAVLRANRECARALADLGVPRPWAVVARKLISKVSQLGRPLDAAPVWRPWDEKMPGPPQGRPSP